MEIIGHSILQLPDELWPTSRRPYFTRRDLMSQLPCCNLPWGRRTILKESSSASTARGSRRGHKVFENAAGFELSYIIGHGTFSTVVMGYWARYKQSVAVKIYSKRKVLVEEESELELGLISIEIEALRVLKHPNIVAFYGAWETKSFIYLVMELIGGGTLLEYLEEHERVVDESQAKLWFAQLVSGIKYAHDLNIAHRDIKLDNLLLDMNHHIRITDFGFALPGLQWSEDVPNYNWPKVSEYVGSEAYMAPEVWAMGIVLFSLLFGSYPLPEFTPETLEVLIRSMEYLEELKPDPSELSISEECLTVFQLIFKYEDDRVRSSELLEVDWLTECPNEIMCGRKVRVIDMNVEKVKAEIGKELEGRRRKRRIQKTRRAGNERGRKLQMSDIIANSSQNFPSSTSLDGSSDELELVYSSDSSSRSEISKTGSYNDDIDN